MLLVSLCVRPVRSGSNVVWIVKEELPAMLDNPGLILLNTPEPDTVKIRSLTSSKV